RKAQAKEERVTEGEYSILAYRLSQDGEKLVVSRSPSPLFDDTDESEIWILNADGSSPLRLTENQVFESGAALSNDGSQVAYITGASADFEDYHNRNLFLVPSGGGPSRLLLEEMPYEVTELHWSGDGKSLFFNANTGIRRQLFRLELETETFEPITQGDHGFRGWHYESSQDLHLVAIEDNDNAGDLWLVPGNAQDPNQSRQVSHLFDDLPQRFLLPTVEAVRWKGADGQQVEGLLFYPLDYQKGERYPLAVQTHGGPAASDKFGFQRWNNYIQVLAARGWMVFRPNYRGSTGYGDAFLRDMVGHYFNQAHLDVMTGVDMLIARGLVDGDRMIKMGWSAGGHMTNKIITFTDRFKAASSGAGAVNWISMYGQSDVRIYRTPWFGGTPWQKDAPIDVYWQNSPLADIWKVKTPTLVLVGENDVRVPMAQSVELYRALRTNGVETKLYVAPRQPHGFRELRHQLFKGNIELEWFEKWALGREYTFEEAPHTEESDEEEEEDEPLAP
ncbi:MAG: S9 family peptidase, partial [Acidobacteriota bacterium]